MNLWKRVWKNQDIILLHDPEKLIVITVISNVLTCQSIPPVGEYPAEVGIVAHELLEKPFVRPNLKRVDFYALFL